MEIKLTVFPDRNINFGGGGGGYDLCFTDGCDILRNTCEILSRSKQ